MTSRLLIGWLGLVLPLVGHGQEPSPAPHANHAQDAAIRVIEGGWGSANLEEIRLVLGLVARQFSAAIDGRAPPPIQVRHRFGSPQVAYDRSVEGEFVIDLTARNERWYQYTYQFAHEYCHVVSRFERKDRGAEIVRNNQWFEESLCETASLYGLRKLAAVWPTDPLAARFPGAARVFSQYADELIAQAHRGLPTGLSFSSWYAQNRDALRNDPYHRELNELVAGVLLPLFEAEPRAWASLAYLNATSGEHDFTFEAYLEAWRSAVPAELRPFVTRIEEAFGLRALTSSQAPPAPDLRSRSNRSLDAAPASGS